MNLVFFHLNGQHVDPASNFPKEWTSFCEYDYKDRAELSLAERIEVAAYDNATLYNDYIVSNIIKLYEDQEAIIIYFADHGDESNDYRPFIGRARNLEKYGAPCLHCQLDIPFIIYTTNKYKINHPEVIKQLEESQTKPFMTDDLPHLLHGLSGISCPYYDNKRDLLNIDFNTQRKRIIKGFSLERPIDYDSICNIYGQWSIGYYN